MHNLILLAALLVRAVLFACFSLRLRQVQKISLRWLGAGLNGLIAIVLFLTCIVASVGHYKQYYSRHAPVPELLVEGSDEQISATICRFIWARSNRPISLRPDP